MINPFVDEINSLFENRFILKRMIYTNFKTRYKRSYLGVIWSLLNPLLNMVVFVVIFSNLFRFDIPHYPLYIFAGNMIFSFYSSSTAEAMMQIIGNGPMIRRVYLPKTVYVISGIGINGINLILTAIPFIIIAFIDKVEYSSALFLIIPAILLLTFFVVGMSLLVATITTYLNDFSQIWSVILTLWMYLTPLFYPETIIPDEFIVAFRLNPMYIFVTLFRDPVLYQKIPDPVLWINGSLYGFGVLILGWWIFTKHSNDFAYRA
ncbi:hypothetical protein BEQ56_10705 [Anaerolineaceae bacterium oral taxon 439]|nr:hypothetical protein BEQ56_10705 [Anaerolineaceae bacterium oral taxon 439]